MGTGNIDSFLDDAVSNRSNEAANLTRLSIEYIFVRVQEKPLERVTDRVQDVVEVGLENGADIDSILSSLVLMTYSSLISDTEVAEQRTSLVRAIKDKLGGSVAILHGNCWGLRGDVRNDRLYCISATLPNLSDMLTELGQLSLNGERELNFQ